jgi:hypothetical protein
MEVAHQQPLGIGSWKGRAVAVDGTGGGGGGGGAVLLLSCGV